MVQGLGFHTGKREKQQDQNANNKRDNIGSTIHDPNQNINTILRIPTPAMTAIFDVPMQMHLLPMT